MTTHPPQPPRSLLPLLIALSITLVFFTWAGSAPDPRFILPWSFTPDEWIEPARSLTLLLAASALLFALLSMLAYRLFASTTFTRAWLSAFLILDAAILLHLILALAWTPLPRDPAAMTGPLITPHLLRWLSTLADLAIIALLLFALRRENKNPWFAALYAFHPLPMLIITSSAPLLPLIVLPILALLIFLPNLRLLYILAAAITSIAMICILSAAAPFDSFLADFLPMITSHPAALLITLHIVALAILLLVALRHNWTAPRTLGHIAILFLLTTPVLTPAMALPMLILLPLAWTRAGWMLTILPFTAYLAIPVFAATHSWHVPSLILLLAWLPPAAVEIQELLEQFAPAQNSPLAPIPQPH